MARIRTIKPAFYKNERLAELPPLTRILFTGLWILADKEGKLEDRSKRIKAEILPYDDFDVDKALWELHDAGFIVRYSVNEIRIIKVLNFQKHQRITGTESSTKSELPDPENSGNILEKSGNTQETLWTTGREGKGRERKGREIDEETGGKPPATSAPKKSVSKKILFRESEFFEKKENLAAALAGTDYEEADVGYYYDSALHWSDSNGNRKVNWLATIKTWMRRDMAEGSFKKANQQIIRNGKLDQRNHDPARPGTVLTPI